MSFSPNLFLSNVRAKDGLAKPSRFEVILPIPAYINSFVGSSILEKILNFKNVRYLYFSCNFDYTKNKNLVKLANLQKLYYYKASQTKMTHYDVVYDVVYVMFIIDKKNIIVDDCNVINVIEKVISNVIETIKQ